MNISEIYFLPPLAIARVGGSDTPLDCFVWDSDRTVYGAHRTIIRPALSLEVLADGSLRPYLPNSIQFKDRGQLRPVAPFFELWATIDDGTDGIRLPLTPRCSRSAVPRLDNVEYTVTVANRKAQRRTGSACLRLHRARERQRQRLCAAATDGLQPSRLGRRAAGLQGSSHSPRHVPGDQAGVPPCHGHRSRRRCACVSRPQRASLRPARRHRRAGVAAAAGSCAACR